jgi:hypothetical protein
MAGDDRHSLSLFWFQQGAIWGSPQCALVDSDHSTVHGCRARKPHRRVSRRSLERHGAGLFVKFPAVPDLVIAVMQRRARIRQQSCKTRLALNQRPRAEILAVEMEKIEEEEDERGGVAAVGRRLDHAERGDAVGAHAAQFAVEIGLAVYGPSCELLIWPIFRSASSTLVLNEIRNRRRCAASWFKASTMTEKPIAA